MAESMAEIREPIVEIVAMGRYLPDRVLGNCDLAKTLNTSDGWIQKHTGIRERRIAPAEQTASEMGARAATIAMERAQVTADEIDLIVVSTATVDRLLPATACDVQALLGANQAAAYDISAGCSGFIYALSCVEGYLAAGRGETALIVSTEKMSAIVDWDDRSTAVLFGDGAGAAVVRRSINGRGLVSCFMRSDGRLAELLWRPGGGARLPMNETVLAEKSHLVKMVGPQVFRAAVRCMTDASERALALAGLTSGDIHLVVPHQANRLIIEAIAGNIGIPMDRVFVNLDRYGNMSSASIPIALDEAGERNAIPDGSHVLLVAFGAGVTWAAAVLRR